MKINLREIQLSKSRPTIPETVNALAESMREVGLLSPIIVKSAVIFDGAIMIDGYKVVAGNHRVSAARALEWTEIDAFLDDGDELKAELAEIDENLLRAELSPAQRASAIHRRKELWAALHPNSDRNPVEIKGRGRPVDFAGDTQRATGEDRRRTNEHLARAEALGNDINEVVGTSLDKGVELDALKELPPNERKDLIDRAKAGENVSARLVQDAQPDKRSPAIDILDWLGRCPYPGDELSRLFNLEFNPENPRHVERYVKVSPVISALSDIWDAVSVGKQKAA